MSETNNPEPVVETRTESASAPNREARYRVERNDARAERDALAERLQRYQRAEVERLASELSEPGDVFTLSGKSLTDFLAESGDIDTDSVATAVADILTTRPGMRKLQLATDPTQGTGNNHVGAPRWADLLHG